MKRKKICMLGAFAVGKTSLVKRFVKSIFSEAYLTTLGVKIDKKSLLVEGQEIELILWDLAGEDDFIKLRSSYLRGSSGFLLVVDCTRPKTLDTALALRKKAESAMGTVPFLLLINKVDLELERNLYPETLSALEEQGYTLVETSAKTGQGVEQAFQMLAAKLYGQKQ